MGPLSGTANSEIYPMTNAPIIAGVGQVATWRDPDGVTKGEGKPFLVSGEAAETLVRPSPCRPVSRMVLTPSFGFDARQLLRPISGSRTVPGTPAGGTAESSVTLRQSDQEAKKQR